MQQHVMERWTESKATNCWHLHDKRQHTASDWWLTSNGACMIKHNTQSLTDDWPAMAPAWSNTTHNLWLSTDQLGFQLGGVVPMPQSPVVAQSPGVQLSAGGDGGAVRAAACYVTHTLGLQHLNHAGDLAVPAALEQTCNVQWNIH